jgi:hypothetical protein
MLCATVNPLAIVPTKVQGLIYPRAAEQTVGKKGDRR